MSEPLPPVPADQVTAIATRAARGHAATACLSAAGLGMMLYEWTGATGTARLIAPMVAAFFALSLLGRLVMLRKARAARRAPATLRWYVRRGQLVAIDTDGVPDPAYAFPIGRADRDAFKARAIALRDAAQSPKPEAPLTKPDA